MITMTITPNFENREFIYTCKEPYDKDRFGMLSGIIHVPTEILYSEMKWYTEYTKSGGEELNFELNI